MIDLKCPDCEANLSFEDGNRKMYFCQYCGAKIVLQDTYNVTNNVTNNSYQGGAGIVYSADELFSRWVQDVSKGIPSDIPKLLKQHYVLDSRTQIVDTFYRIQSFSTPPFKTDDFGQIREFIAYIKKSSLKDDEKNCLVKEINKKMDRMRKLNMEYKEREQERERKTEIQKVEEEKASTIEKNLTLLKVVFIAVVICILLFACSRL